MSWGRPGRSSGGRSRRGQRRFVNRAWTGLRHDHPRRRRHRSGRPRRSRALNLHLRNITVCRRLRRCRSTGSLRCRSHRRHSWRNRDRRRYGTRGRGRRRRGGRGHRSFGRYHDHRRWTVRRRYRSRRNHSRRRRRRRFARGLGRNSLRGSLCFGFHRRYWGRSRRLDYRTRRGLFNHSLLLGDGAQHVAGPRDMRKVDLGLDLFFTASRARSRPRRTGRFVGAAAEMFPHQFRFVFL
jgi:hypothetical protein